MTQKLHDPGDPASILAPKCRQQSTIPGLCNYRPLLPFPHRPDPGGPGDRHGGGRPQPLRQQRWTTETSRRSGRIVSSLLWIVLWSIPSASLQAQLPKPPQERVDEQRSVEKQTQAARQARDRVRQGPGDIQQVIVLLGDSSGMVRDEVFEHIVQKWSDEDRSKLRVGFPRRGARDPAPEGIEEILAEIYLRCPDPSVLLELLAVALGSHSADAREMALGALAALPKGSHDKRSLQVLLNQAKRGLPWYVRGEAMRALAIHDAAGALPILERALREKKLPALRIAALQALAVADLDRGGEAAFEAVTRPWKDRQGIWGGRIRRAALQVLAGPGASLPRARRGEFIGGLIESASTMEGSTQAQLWSTLAALTEQDGISSTASSWDSWWKSRKQSWLEESTAAPVPEVDPDTAGEESAADDTRGTRVVRYHGVPLDSKRIVFLSDVSGGMSRDVDGNFDVDGARRIDVARAELLRVLGQLPRDAMVQVVHFASRSLPALPRVQPLGVSRKELEKQIRAQQVPTGRGAARGNLHGPLRRAVLEPGTDTVMLLTEGAPTEGKIQSGERLRWHIRRWNRWGQARIHVLSVGRIRGANRAFLEGLAADAGGVFHDVEASFGKQDSGS